MKYGLIVHFKTRNIGDDIQCYAMEKFLPHLDYLIDREHLDSFYTPTGEKVATFLGGWYMHKPLNWPPSPFLKILPIAFHLTMRDGKGNLALTDYGTTWLKKVAPIGCRDEGTAEILQSCGVPAYFSGCFTLTIKPFANVAKHGKIVLADCTKEVADFIKQNTKKEIVIVSHKYSKPKLPPEVIKFAEEHDTKISVPTSHKPAQLDEPHEEVCYKGSWSYRRALVEGLLRFYQGASLVVTKRLHVSLPCLALGTPVLLVRTEENLLNYRLSTYLPYLNHTTPELAVSSKLLSVSNTPAASSNYFFMDSSFNSSTANDLFSKKFSFDFNNPPPNPGGHEKLVEKIRTACSAFISSCENDMNTSRVDVETWWDDQQRILRLKRIIKTLMPSLQSTNSEPLNENIYKA